MNWDAIGAVGEIIGAVAVIATLIYLAKQIKDSARAARSAAVTDATTAMQAFYLELGRDPQVSEGFLQGLRSYESLPASSQFQWLMLMHSCFLGFQRAFFLAKEGTLDADLRDSIGTAIVSVNHMEGMAAYWRQRKIFFQPQFIAWVEELLEREPLTDMHPYHRRADTD